MPAIKHVPRQMYRLSLVFESVPAAIACFFISLRFTSSNDLHSDSTSDSSTSYLIVLHSPVRRPSNGKRYCRFCRKQIQKLCRYTSSSHHDAFLRPFGNPNDFDLPLPLPR